MIPLFRPTIRRRDMDRVLTCMVSDSVGSGRLSHEVVDFAVRYFEAAGGLALASYYDALAAALSSLELEPGSGVILSALSPALYLDVLEGVGLEPLMADVDPQTGVMASQEATRLAAGGASAILAHYTLGFVPPMEALAAIGLPLIEDLSQGLGATSGDRRCGTFGTVIVTALDPEGIITAGGGGLVLARDRVGLRRLREVAAARHQGLPDMNGALALAQVREIEGFVAARKQIAAAYRRSLQRSRHRGLEQTGEADNVPFSFPVLLESGMKEARQYARRKAVETAPAYEGSALAARLTHLEAGDAERIGLANSRSALLRCLLFPLYPTLAKARVEEVARVLTTLP